jgi:Ca-activated chloride channel family protein
MKENTGPGPDGDAGYIPDRSGGTGRDALSVIDEGQLRQIAGDLGIPYVHRSAGDAAAAMLQEATPGSLHRGEGDGSVDGRTELYWILAAGAFLLALRESVLVLRQLRRLRPARDPLQRERQPGQGASP